MGTRHFTSIILNGEHKVCQYGQWDGYPTYTGVKLLEFIRDNDLDNLKEAIANTFITKTPHDDARSYTGSTKDTTALYRKVFEKQNELNKNPAENGKWYGIYDTATLMLKESELTAAETDLLLASTRDTGVEIIPYIYNRDLGLPPLELFAIEEEYEEVSAFANKECKGDIPPCDAQGYFVVDLDKNKVFMNFDKITWRCNIDDLPQDIDRTMALFEVKSRWMDIPKTVSSYLDQINEELKGFDQPELTPEETKEFLAFCSKKYPHLAAEIRSRYQENRSLSSQIASASSKLTKPQASPDVKVENIEHSH